MFLCSLLLFLLFVSIANGATSLVVTVALSNTAPNSVKECQTSAFTTSIITATFTCTAGSTFTVSVSRSVTPTGPALACFDVTTATATPCSGTTLSCGDTCTVQLIINPTLAGCVLNYEELSSPSFTYGVVIVFDVSTNYAGANAITLAIPLEDCNEAPYFSNVAYNSQLPEYINTPTTYAGSIGSVDVRDPDIYGTTYGKITMSVTSVTNTGTSSVLLTDPFYFNATSANSHITTTLCFDTSLCASAQQSTCLSYFHYVSATNPVLEIVIRATDGGGLAASVTYTVTVSLVYSAPVLTNLPETVSVGETQTGGTSGYSLYPLTATSSNSLTVTFYVTTVYPPNGVTYFGIAATCSATVSAATYCKDVQLTSTVTTDTLNYYAVPQYNLTIWATVTTPANTVLSATSSLIVKVTLVNRTPIPTVTSGSMSIGEDQTTGSCFWTITASDRESDTILFSWIDITPSTGAAVDFSVTSQGVLCFTDSTKIGACCDWIFDYNSASNYVMKVKIYDAYSTQTPYTFTFTLSILYRNRPPTITGVSTSTVSFWECVTSGTVNTLSATDPEYGTLTFAIGQPQPSNTLMFFMSPTTAKPTAAAAATSMLKYQTPPPLNSSITPLYLNTTVTDGSWTVYTTMIINIKYCDVKPYFINLPAITYLNENLTGTGPFFTVSSYDTDGDIPSYYFKLSNGSSASTNGYFLIGTTSGIMQYSLGSTPVFDAYNTPSYSLTVILTNTPSNGPNFTTVTMSNQVSVLITPIDKPPTFLEPNPTTGNTTYVYENSSYTYSIYKMNATDREGDTLFYTILSMRPIYNSAFHIPYGLNYLEFNVQSANSTPPLDYYQYNVYYIVMQVADTYTTPTSTATLTINIIHCDRAPIWSSLPATVSVREDVIFPADLVTVGARDVNTGSNYVVTYNYTGVTPANASSKFYFNTDTNAFGYNAYPGFNYQTQNAYQAVFVATNGILASTSYVNILIVQRSSPTASGGSYSNTVTISEKQSYASLIWDLRTTDNSSKTLTYGIISVAPATNIFTVTKDGLVKIQSNPNINYQAIPEYVLKLSVVSSNLPPTTTTFTLTVKVLNEASMPVLSNLPNSITITEGVPGAGVVFTPICVDEDGRTLSFSSSIQPPAAQEAFSVDATNGLISTVATAQLVYKSTPNIYITLTCSNSYYSASATLSINVQYTQYWSVTRPMTTEVPTTSTTTVADCPDCLSSSQIGAIAGSIIGTLALAGIAYGMAKVMQNKAAKLGTLQNIRQYSPPPRYDYYR